MVISKLAASRLLVPGCIVGSTDGQPRLVLSRISTKDGVVCKLADLMGKPVLTPSDFDPVPMRIARIATLLKLAYNKQVDAYVKDGIRDAGLPVDQSMQWDNYLYEIFAKSLKKVGIIDEEDIDETIHHVIYLMFQRHILDQQLPHIIENFTKSPKQPDFAGLPLEKQITKVLKSNFIDRVGEAQKYAREVIQGQDVSENVTGDSLLSMTPEEEGEPGLLDIMQSPNYTRDLNRAENNAELGDYRGRWNKVTKGHFAEGFKDWLLKKYRLPAVRQSMRLLTLLYDQTEVEGKMLKLRDIEEEWKKLQDRNEPSRNRLNHDRFEKLFQSLPEVVEIYVRTHFHGQEHALPDLIRLLNRQGQERRKKRLEESQRGMENRHKQKKEEVPAPEPIPSTEEAALKDSPPESHVSAQKKQWEPPKCRNCGSGKEPKRCKGCQEFFCSGCMRDHVSNNPSHDGVL
jgi:hypothetical protein